MMRRTRATLAVLGALLLLLGAGLAQPLAGDEGEERPTSLRTSAEKSRGGEAEEMPAEAVNNADSPPAAPPDKGGEKTRQLGGGYCLFVVSNWTPWYIHIYANGEYTGTVSPWGEWSGWRTQGTLRMFARAPFDDGSSLTWGPTDGYCEASFTWRLDP